MKWLAKLSIFIILLLVSEFVVVVLLSEWWLFYLSDGQGRPLLTTVGTSLPNHLFKGCSNFDSTLTDIIIRNYEINL